MAIRNKSWSVAKFSCPWRTAVMKGKSGGKGEWREGRRDTVNLVRLPPKADEMPTRIYSTSICYAYRTKHKPEFFAQTFFALFFFSFSFSFFSSWLLLRFSFFFWLSSCQRKFGSWQMKSWRDTIWTDAVVVALLLLLLLAICNKQSIDHDLEACRERENQCGMKHLQILRIVNWVTDQ